MSESLSLCLLCFNDAPTIQNLVRALDETARKVGRDYEILVADDGSTDSSREILAGLQKEIPALKLVFHEKNGGYGATVRSLFGAARNDLVFYTDGDGQYDVREFPRLLEMMTEDVAMVSGYKIKRHDPLFRIWAGWFYQGVMRWWFHFRTKDLTCDFRLIRRRLLKNLALRASSGAICSELVVRFERAGFKTADCPVSHYPRRYGRSQFFNFRRLFETFREILELHRSLRRGS